MPAHNAAMLEDIQKDFLKLLIDREALKFGEFTLKSGRSSPYYINTGCFHHASDMQAIGTAYASTIKKHFGNDVDVVFGPAYKGIPLALASADALQREHQHDISWAYDRKETKDHGDGGNFVGAPLDGGKRIVIVDDVLTAGTALRESFNKLKDLDVEVVGAVISIDRMEPGTSEKRASQEIADEFNVPIHCVVTILDAVNFLIEEGIDGQHYVNHEQAAEIKQRIVS